MAWPTSSLEDWRYSRIDSLDVERYPRLTVAPAAGTGHAELDRLVAAVGATSALIETTDGFLVAPPVVPPVAPRVDDRTGDAAVRVTTAAASSVPVEDLAPAPDAFATANRAFAPDPVVVTVGRGARPAPVVVVHWVGHHEVTLFPRVRIEAAEDSEVTVLEVVAGPGRSLVVPVTELEVGRAARLSYLQLQMLGTEAWQIGWQVSRLAADATLTSAAVALGGDYARLRTDSVLAGPGGSSRLLALYFGTGTQMRDFRTVQDHRVPKTTSDLLYKGAVANTARSVYSGLIRVEKGARGTNAFQTNRNLVLHEGAHADSIPNLEIEDNDVRCSHASAVGPVSEDERFYLESRGVPPEVTDRLITLGFLGEVIEELPLPALGPGLTRLLAEKLAEAESIEAAR